MVVISQNRRQVIPFEKFVFSATDTGKIVAAPDIIGDAREFDLRVIATYSSAEIAEEELKAMVCAYRMGCEDYCLSEEV